MSVVIVGGNECMTRQYKDMCESYQYKEQLTPFCCVVVKNIW